MDLRLTTTFVLILACLLCFSVAAQESIGSIEIKDEEGFLNLTMPLLSFQNSESGSIEVTGQGQLGKSSQRLRFHIRPNRSKPRKGLTRTDKSCLMSFDDELFRTLAKQLSIALPSSEVELKPHTFDLVEVEGSLESTAKLPVKLELIDLQEDDFYSEWYLTIDVPKKRIVLSEKNNEYREPFIRTFLR